MNKRLLAVSWVMPPIVVPRPIQVSRLLAAMNFRGWHSRIVTAEPTAIEGLPRDDTFGAHYTQAYDTIPIEMREERSASDTITKWRRTFNPPANFADANWRERAVKASVSQIDRWAPDVLVTFAQPWIDHQIGLEVRERRPGIPWIAHFSDPWVDSPYYVKYPPQPEIMAIWRRQESAVINRADGIIFVTPETRSLVMGKYSKHLARKSYVMPHGYDRSFLGLLAPSETPKKPLRMVYTGNIYAGMREPDLFLRALSRLHEESPLTDLIEIEIVGAAPEETKQAALALPIGESIKFRGHVGYVESLEAAARADLLLLIDAPAKQSVFLPSKIMDYLMLDKPVLGLTPTDGAAANLLRSCGFPIAPPDDIDAMTAALRPLIEAARRGQPLLPPANRAAIAGYDIRRTAAVFESAILDAIERRSDA